jgi:hypothetical protein
MVNRVIHRIVESLLILLVSFVIWLVLVYTLSW